MPRREILGYTPRSIAQKIYGRSKSSFIRDVDDAFARDDREFLRHFRVNLNDGTIIEGAEATKDAVFAVQSKQPRWYIETEFLDTRYWDQGNGTAEEGTGARAVTSTKTANSQDVVGLNHQLALAEQQIRTQGETISRLEGDKNFLQTELENRRGEIEKLQRFFASVGEAADSAAKLAAGREEQGKSVDSTVSRNGSTETRDTVVERYLPTFQRLINKIRPIK